MTEKDTKLQEDFPVFPAADVFPMMAEDELRELAEDIKANGLREPVVLAVVDGERVLVDGRNRLAAWKMAGPPEDGIPFAMLDEGTDPTAYVLSANIRRRHMNKGQLAMAHAMIFPEKQQGKKGTSQLSCEVTSEYLRMARSVLAWSETVARSVLIGARTLSGAYAEYQESKREPEEEAADDEAEIAALRARYPDLADKVVDEGLNLKAAKVQADENDRTAREKRDAMFQSLKKGWEHVGFLAAEEHANKAWKMAGENRDKFRELFDNDNSKIDEAVAALRNGCARLIDLLNAAKEAPSEEQEKRSTD